MTLTAIRYTTVVLINGVMVRIADEPSITESLDGFATVTEFELLDRPATIPAEDDVVQVWRVNLSDSTYIPLFGGYLLGRDVESEPHQMVFRAIDELSKLDAIRTTSDLDLTGMTDGEAWQAVAGVCGVSFDPLDIQDTGYVLGERAPVYWKVGSSGASVIQELDRVFGTKTMTVLNNRVVRFAYDRVASSANIQRTYTKGESADFWKHHKATGDSDQVQSMWEVQGGSVPCGDQDSCSCVVWAKSIGTTPKKGKMIQAIPTSTFQSDLIQDEVLAAAISRRLMRWYNRVPIILSAEVETDANIHPGSVIGVFDPTYAFDDTSTKPYTVLTCDKRGSFMTISAVGGVGGSTGTTTTGVEQRCNNTNLDIDWGGDWDLPDITLPPLGDFSSFGGFDFDLDWTIHGDTEDDDGGIPGLADWQIMSGIWAFGDGFAYGGGSVDAEAFYTGSLGPLVAASPRPQYVRFAGTLTFNSFVDYNDTAWIMLYDEGDTGVAAAVEFYATGINGAGDVTDWTVDAYGNAALDYEFFSTALDTTQPVDFVITWDDGVGFTVNLNAGEFDWTMAYTDTYLIGPLRLQLLAVSNGEAVHFDNLAITTGAP